MQIASIVYQRYLASTGSRRLFWSRVRQILIRVLRDPSCSLMIHGRCLSLPLSHSLPDYLEHLPFYDRLPQRISKYVHQTQGQLTCIDIGANIGDTIASFCSENADQDIFLAVEPNPTFGRYLSKNWGWNANVTVASVLCSSRSSSNAKFTVHEKSGTASIVQTQNGITLERETLDELVCHHPFARAANVVKIDTDGHDFEVIIGAEKLLASNLPFLLFECDVFANPNYFEDCLHAFSVLQCCGYNQFLLYDNFGYLMGKYLLSDLGPFRHLLFYQLTSRFNYFDLLVMPDEDIARFHRLEVEHFATKMVNKSLCATAIATAGF